jgi:uncharacterized iron-regulated membrane protein
MYPIRPILIHAHRYFGLVMALFLVVAGVTGSILPFYDSLDHYINQSIYDVPSQNQTLIDPLILRNKVLADYPSADINYIELETKHGRSIKVYLDAKRTSQGKAILEDNELYVNPYTGEVIGARRWGDITQGMKNLMPFVFRLHYSLALKGVGILIFGVIALLWTIDCFVGAYLTFPVKQSVANKVATTKAKIHHWRKRWAKAWKIRWHSSLYKLNFDIHRAFGLWFWAVLFVFAWSSVGFNLQQVYSPVMRSIFSFNDVEQHVPILATPLERPSLDYIQARELGRKYAQQTAKELGFRVIHESVINLDSSRGVYRYIVKTSADNFADQGQTRFYIEANRGDLLHIEAPALEKTGDVVTKWLFWIHMAEVGGVPMQIFVSFMGLMVSMLTVSGVYIWWKKRHARAHAYFLSQRSTQAWQSKTKR